MSIFSPQFTVFDSAGNKIATVSKKKAAIIMARAAMGWVRNKSGNAIYDARNPLKKKKKKAKRNTAKRSTARKTKKRAPAKKNKARKPARKPAKKKAARSKSNPGKALKAKIAQMKPKAWYSTTLSGAKVKVQRKGQSLIIRPATKRRSR